MKRKNRCFINQTHIWKWSLDALFFGRKSCMYWYKTIKNDENETIICLWQNDQKQRNSLFSSFGQKQIFVLHDDQKREFLFFGHVIKNKYLILPNVPKKNISFFGSFCQYQIFVFGKMTEKKKFPFLVICHKSNICFCMFFTDIFASFFLAFCTFPIMHSDVPL